jgi:hypothetical protein
MKTIGMLMAAIAIGAGASPAKAAFLVEYSPSTTGATITPPGNTAGAAWSNQSTGQNFAESLLFNNAVTATAMDIYTGTGFAPVGTSVTIRLWTDNLGTPGSLITTFTEAVALHDSDGNAGKATVFRIRANFTNDLHLAANTRYWIGMSGTTSDIGQLGLTAPNAPDNGSSAKFSGTTFQNHATDVGDLAFRLEGSVDSLNAVPAPPGAVLAAIGAFGLIGIRMIRRKTMTAIA